jgi:hypothetical protein
LPGSTGTGTGTIATIRAISADGGRDTGTTTYGLIYARTTRRRSIS